jgi:hypothetical protein
MRLAELQRLFRDALLAPTGDGPEVAAASRHVNGSRALAPEEHVRIYRRAVAGTLVRALADIHPVCRRLTGPAFFDAMAREYARCTPSRSVDLADYGGGFGEFVAGFPPAAGLPYLADVARLEWHWHRAFHAPASPPLDASELARLSPEAQARVRFRLPASAALLQSPYPVHRIWETNQPGHDGDASVSLDEGAARLVVWRSELALRIDPLDAREWWLLTAARDGRALGELDDVADLPDLLPRCVARGWLAGFEILLG